MDLVINVGKDTYQRALSDWAWLLQGGPFAPITSSLFGDTFLHGPGGIWYLSTLEGTLTREWSDVEELKALLGTDEGQDDFLLGGLALSANARGVQAAEGEMLMFGVPPILGGGFQVDRISTIDFVVGMSILGQLHRQLQGNPPPSPTGDA